MIRPSYLTATGMETRIDTESQ